MATDARSEEVRLKAEAGDAEAVLELANGSLLDTDPEGRVWLDRAAQAGSAGACAALGWSHEKGLHGGAVDQPADLAARRHEARFQLQG